MIPPSVPALLGLYDPTLPRNGQVLALHGERLTRMHLAASSVDFLYRESAGEGQGAVGLRGRHASATRVLIATETDPGSRPGEPATPRGARSQGAEVASSLWSEPTLTSMRRGFACSATGMATVNTPPS